MKEPCWPTIHSLSIKFTKLGFERIGKLLKKLENPQDKMPSIFHVAGTNGKGSVLSFIKAILEAQNYKAHRYISPHLIDFNERIEITGKQISDNYLNELVQECKIIDDKYKIDVSFFEGITVMAFLAFARNKADATLLEVGMGGRLDATNVIKKPLITIITSISLDHMHCLGNNIKTIAEEKAAIIKSGCPVIISKQKKAASDIINRIAKEKNSPVYEYEKHWFIHKTKYGFIFEGFDKKLQLPFPSLAGDHQIINCGCAIAALLAQNKLKISEQGLVSGITHTEWPGRLQNLNNTRLNIFDKNSEVWLDSAHNEDGAKKLAAWLNNQNKINLKKTVLVLGMLKRKQGKELFLKNLNNTFDLLITTNISGEEQSANEMEKIAISLGIKNCLNLPSFQEAQEYIKQNFKNVRIVFCGSVYFAGEILQKV